MKSPNFRPLRSFRGAAAMAIVAALTVSLVASSALACGGFFCFTQPIDQSAERVLYVQGDSKLSVHIQISYQGDDDNFSWVLPLPAIPDLGVGSDFIFQLLEQETSPRFQLEWKNTPNCSGYQPCMMMDAAAGGGTGTKNGGDGVEVVKKGNVGPYDYEVVKAGEGSKLFDWLNKNKYVQPPAAKPLIEAYVAKGHYFLALKLSKDASAGDITPIVVHLDETSPCLPIRLTSIAARPDMPIVTWTLGKARAIPKNFLHVVLNDAALDWMKPGANYKTVVSKAVDQASGHAFTTEFAKPTSKWNRKFANANWKPQDLAKITDPTKFLQKLLMDGYPRTAQMQEIIRDMIPKPDKYKDVDDRDFYNCIGQEWNNNPPCSDYKAAVKAQKFDAQGFVDKLVKYVVTPLKDMDTAIGAHAWMTRLYTTLDAQEMDKDPIFAFNATLPEVDNVRKAVAVPICEAGKKQATKAELLFADGNKLTVDIPKDDNCTWDFNGGATAFGKGTDPIVKAGGQPAKQIQVLDETGAPVDIHPADADKVDAELNKAEAGKPSLSDNFKQGLRKAEWKYTDPVFDPGTGGAGSGSSGGSTGSSGGTAGQGGGGTTGTGTTDSSCSATSTSNGAAPILTLVLLAGIALWRRRRVI